MSAPAAAMHVNVDYVKVLAPTATAATVMLFPSALFFILILILIRFAFALLGGQGTLEQRDDSAVAGCHADRLPALGARCIEFFVVIVADCDEAVFESDRHSRSVRGGGELTGNR